MSKKPPIIDFYKQKKKEWWEGADWDSAKEQHLQNIQGLKNAEDWKARKDRPITITVVHGSGRHPTKSCAHELSNSALLLERGLNLAIEEADEKPEVWTYNLREMFLEPCNNCVSTASPLCGFPCTCFVGDDVTTKIYPAVMASDILLMSTPINQAMISSRLKIVLDRLISLDGGYYNADLPVKDSSFRQKMITLAEREPVYDKRMFGKVAAYFVTSKDLNNPHEEEVEIPKPFHRLTYEDTVVGALAIQGSEYGWYHANPYYVVAAADPDVDYSKDKSNYDKQEKAHEEAKKVVEAAISLAKKHREYPPELTNPGRINRT